jgi:RNA polymerase sigma-70 factor (ECF subfamily)
MTTPSPDHDLIAGLVRRCADRDDKALAELHRQLARRIHAFAFQRLRNSTDAETVVTDTLMEVWRSAARFKGASLATTWILGIARFKCLQLRDAAPPDHDDIDDYAESLASADHGVEASIEAWQQARQVRDCMDGLTQVHRECLHLVYFDGLPLGDVARIQQVPENTVKTRLFHARRNMRTCVEAPPKRSHGQAERRISA